MSNTFYWYDLETTGIDSTRDRVVQFAGLRTDLDLNPVAEPDVFYCKLHDDVLPHPEACLVTGISPQLANEKGLLECDFIARIQLEFSTPQTCVVGFNSIRFDDEFTRNLLYRNFFDPYAREWKSGNSRWDIIDVVRLTHALRPEGIQWPKREDGTPSFRLELLTAENNIKHESAHDALSDVYATIAVAKLIKEKQPKLYSWALALKDKRKALENLDLQEKTAMVHVSGKYPASRHCLAIVLPLAQHPINKNGVIAYDLSVEPTPLLNLDVDEIYRRMYTATEDLAKGEERIPLKVIHVNKSPMLAPVNTLSTQVAEHLNLDLQQCEVHRKMLLNANLDIKLKEVFSKNEFVAEQDPDLMLYGGGFFSATDARNMEQIRKTPAEQLASLDLPFEDDRLPDMLFRYRARNYPQTLSEQEKKQWLKHRKLWLMTGGEDKRLSLPRYFGRLDELVAEGKFGEQEQELLGLLIEYGEQLESGLAD
ncbi:MAG: exodeoxyribonuclease I [Cycloclasticus sp. symbiont of Poecilosclerida sp. M]|nr:MAG: exodeoxyribonuclease I [Cycloclasticus sp. symbiont of Poecilosclerida sp. M]